MVSLVWFLTGMICGMLAMMFILMAYDSHLNLMVAVETEQEKIERLKNGKKRKECRKQS